MAAKSFMRKLGLLWAALVLPQQFQNTESHGPDFELGFTV
jgi:hypothetical protein